MMPPGVLSPTTKFFSLTLSLSLSSRLISIALPPFFLLSLGFSLRLADRDPSLSPEVALELAF